MYGIGEKRRFRSVRGYALSGLIGTILLLMGGCGQDYGGYIAQLRSGTPEQRAAAASFVGAQRISSAIPALRGALRDTVAEVRAKASWALGMLRSKEVVPDLLPMLRDTSGRVRQQVVWALMQIEEPEAVPALEVALRMEKDPWVQGDLRRAIAHLKQFQGEVDIGESTFR